MNPSPSVVSRTCHGRDFGPSSCSANRGSSYSRVSSVDLCFNHLILSRNVGGILIFGIGLEYAKAVCTIAIYLCIFFYASSKLFFYAFLGELLSALFGHDLVHNSYITIAEKVYIVWSRANGVRRFESPVYLTCVVSVSFYCIVMTLMLGGVLFHFLHHFLIF